MIPYSAIRYTFLGLIVGFAVVLFVVAVGLAHSDSPKSFDHSAGMTIGTWGRGGDTGPDKRERDPQREEPRRVEPRREEPQRQEPQRVEPRREEPQREPIRIDRTPPQREEPRRQDPPPRQDPQRQAPDPTPGRIDRTPRQDPAPRVEPRVDPPRVNPTPPGDRRNPPDRTPPKRVEPDRPPKEIDRTPRQDPNPNPNPPKDVQPRTPPVVDRNDRERRDGGNGPRAGWEQSPSPDNRDRRDGLDRGPKIGPPGNVKGIDLDPKVKEERQYPVYVERKPTGERASGDRDAWQPRGPDASFRGRRENREYGVTHKYSPSYHRLERWCGPASYYYVWRPYWEVKEVFGVYFYFGHYVVEAYPSYPYAVYPGWYYWSPYRYYRTVPGYCYWSSSISVDNDFYWPRYDNSYYGGGSGDSIDDVVRDLQDAWYNGDADRLSRRLDRGDTIRVYFDNDYAYSVPAQDYYEMTLDTIATAYTDRLEFGTAKYLGRGMAFLSGSQHYQDLDGQWQTVYLSFTLRKEGGWWKIVAVGTSDNSIRYPPSRW